MSYETWLIQLAGLHHLIYFRLSKVTGHFHPFEKVTGHVPTVPTENGAPVLTTKRHSHKVRCNIKQPSSSGKSTPKRGKQSDSKIIEELKFDSEQVFVETNQTILDKMLLEWPDEAQVPATKTVEDPNDSTSSIEEGIVNLSVES